VVKMSLDKIENLVLSYGFKANVFHDMILVKSRFDEWCIEKCNDTYILKHQNTNRNPSKKFRQHIQKKFINASLENVLNSILRHDDYVLKHKNNMSISLFNKFKKI